MNWDVIRAVTTVGDCAAGEASGSVAGDAIGDGAGDAAGDAAGDVVVDTDGVDTWPETSGANAIDPLTASATQAPVRRNLDNREGTFEFRMVLLTRTCDGDIVAGRLTLYTNLTNLVRTDAMPNASTIGSGHSML